MSRVFISHSSHDQSLARTIQGWLSAAGHDVFLDVDRDDGIAVGEDWERRLHEELRRADAMVCVVTSAYVASRWCTAEVAVARSRGCRVLPVQAEPGVVHELLGALQHVALADAERSLPEALRRVGAVGWPDGRSPYPGLVAFDADMRSAFFGRESDLNDLMRRIRSKEQIADQSVLLVVGPSGSGKSSLVRAGLAPAIEAEPDWWRLAPMVPRGDPVAALERELAASAAQTRLGWRLSDVQRELAAVGLAGVVDELLLAAPGGRARRLLIVVDQFEELLNVTSAGERARFAALLAPALAGPAQVVATLRSEFLESLLADPDLGVLPTSVHVLGSMRPQGLRTVIVKPAELAGISVADDLVEELIADTATGDALPLLAFTLAQLAEGVVRGGALTGQRYRQLGGVRGALTGRADAALATAAARSDRDQVLDALVDLAAVDDRDRIVRRPVRQDTLPDVSAFVDARLLTTDTPDAPVDRTVYVEVTHESFLTAWAPLAERISDRVAALRARRAVELAAEEGRLWEGGQLAAAKQALGFPDRLRVRLSDPATTFLRASARRDRLRRTRAVSILSALLAVAVVAALVAGVQQRSAQRSQRVAISRQLVAQAEVVRDTDPRTGLLLAVAAERIQPAARNRAMIAAELLATRYAGALTGHTAQLTGTASRPDGSVLATVGLDGRVILWDVAGRGGPRPLAAPIQLDITRDGELGGPAAFSPDGRLLAAARVDGSVLLYDVSDPTAPHRLPSHIGEGGTSVGRMAFAPDGRTLAVVRGSTPAVVTLWDIRDPSEPRARGRSVSAGDFCYQLSFDRTGRWLITAAALKSGYAVRIWGLSKPTPVARTSIPYDHAAAFHQTSGVLAVGETRFDDTGSLWDLSDPGHPRRSGEIAAPPGSSSLSHLDFSTDGEHLAVVGTLNRQSSVGIYEVTDPDHPNPIERPTSTDGNPASGGGSTDDDTYIRSEAIHQVNFLPGRPAVAVVAGDDMIVTLWDYTDPTRPRRTGQSIAGARADSRTVVILPDGSRALTDRADGALQVWDLTSAGSPEPAGPAFARAASIVASIAFRDDHTLLVGRTDGSITRWDIADPATPRQSATPLRSANASGDRAAVIGPAGAVVAVEASGGAVEVMDTENPSRHSTISQPFFPGKGGRGGVGTMAFAPSGSLLAIPVTSWGTYVTLWNVSDPARPQRLGDHLEARDIGDAVAFSGDARTLAYTQGFGAQPGAILMDITEPTTPRMLAEPLTGHTDQLDALAFAPNGSLLATGSADRSVFLWDVTDPTQPVRLSQPLTGFADTIRHLAFSPDGRILVVVDGSGITQLWDVEDPDQPLPLGLPLTTGQERVDTIALSPGGHTLALAHTVSDGSHAITIWRLTDLHDLLADPVQAACQRTGGGLDHTEWRRYVGSLPHQQIC